MSSSSETLEGKGGNEKPKPSYFFSNFAFKTVFDLVGNGASPEVRDKLMFHSRGKPVDRVNELFPVTVELFTLTGSAGGPRIDIPRRIWVHWPLELKDGYYLVIQKIYTVDLHHHAFPSLPDDSSDNKKVLEKGVNGWIQEKTGGFIQDCLGRIGFQLNTRLILPAALKFQGEWVEAFQDAGDHEFKFVNGNTAARIPFITSKGKHYLQQYTNFKALNIPFKQHPATDFSMLFYLPDGKTKDDIEDLRKFIGEYETVFHELHLPKEQARVGNLRIPKFRVKVRGPVNDVAGGVVDQMAADSPLTIAGARGSGFVEIDAEGVRAAGATSFFIRENNPVATEAVRPGDPSEREVPGNRVFGEKRVDEYAVEGNSGVAGSGVETGEIDFVADRPFLFFIRDNKFGRMLFSGGVFDSPGVFLPKDTKMKVEADEEFGAEKESSAYFRMKWKTEIENSAKLESQLQNATRSVTKLEKELDAEKKKSGNIEIGHPENFKDDWSRSNDKELNDLKSRLEDREEELEAERETSTVLLYRFLDKDSKLDREIEKNEDLEAKLVLPRNASI